MRTFLAAILALVFLSACSAAGHGRPGPGTDAGPGPLDGATTDAANQDASRDGSADAAFDADAGAGEDSGTVGTDADVADASGDAGVRDAGILCAPGEGTIEGTVYAPNGVDPISTAVIWIPLTGEPVLDIAPGVACDRCPIGGSRFRTTSATDGTFVLTTGAAGGDYEVVVQNGRFRRVVTVHVDPCGRAVMSPAETTLPGTTDPATAGPGVVMMPRILVATGTNDNIARVLRLIGITQFDSVDGGRTAGSRAAVESSALGAVLLNRAMLDQYNLVFAGCGSLGGGRADALQSPTLLTSVSDWLAVGGRLYSSDLSYILVSATVPTMASWATGERTGIYDAHDVGYSASATAIIQATIDDVDLRSWMSVVGALRADGRVDLTQFRDPWGAVDTVPTGTRNWVHGDVQWHVPVGMTTAAADHPLTIQRPVPDAAGATCGQAFFSSYHTSSSTTGTTLSAQERLLEYLIFQLAKCNG